MAGQQTCFNKTTGRAKVSYPTRAAAIKAARRTHSGLHLSTYSCRFCGGFHLTQEEQRKVEQPPSAAKLRRMLKDRAAQIAATEKRLTEAERTYLEQLRYVHREMDRIIWQGVKSK